MGQGISREGPGGAAEHVSCQVIEEEDKNQATIVVVFQVVQVATSCLFMPGEVVIADVLVIVFTKKLKLQSAIALNEVATPALGRIPEF